MSSPPLYPLQNPFYFTLVTAFMGLGAHSATTAINRLLKRR